MSPLTALPNVLLSYSFFLMLFAGILQCVYIGFYNMKTMFCFRNGNCSARICFLSLTTPDL